MDSNVSFAKAPLIEIIAELRWVPPGTVEQPGQPAFTNDADQLAMSFNRQLAVASFPRAEKLVPPGFPSMLHEVAWRFRNPGDAGTLLQIGGGIFTANALPPYKRWSAFRPTVEKGVEALLAARLEAEKDLPFSGLSLCYMNAFSPEAMKKCSQQKFIEEVLGFRVDLPSALKKIESRDQHNSTTINLLVPIGNTSKKLVLVVADGSMRQTGSSQNTPVVLMNMTVLETVPVAPNVTSILGAFDEARNIIHNAFMEMTSSIHNLMQPEEAA
ncbi:MAG: TIGR04255 family protein [Hyphomicrobiaceae bacterium]|nr:TIGR04255 family protein [Hyphomicrobiaceae bacterium]